MTWDMGHSAGREPGPLLRAKRGIKSDNLARHRRICSICVSAKVGVVTQNIYTDQKCLWRTTFKPAAGEKMWGTGLGSRSVKNQ